MEDTAPKDLVWVGSSRKDLKAMPLAVRRSLGFSLFAAQLGEWPRGVKPLKGFGGTGVLEILEDHDGDTYRAVYTVRFATKIYVLHVFQKKSKHGISTPDQEIDLIRERLKWAERLHAGKGMES